MVSPPLPRRTFDEQFKHDFFVLDFGMGKIDDNENCTPNPKTATGELGQFEPLDRLGPDESRKRPVVTESIEYLNRLQTDVSLKWSLLISKRSELTFKTLAHSDVLDRWNLFPSCSDPDVFEMLITDRVAG